MIDAKVRVKFFTVVPGITFDVDLGQDWNSFIASIDRPDNQNLNFVFGNAVIPWRNVALVKRLDGKRSDDTKL